MWLHYRVTKTLIVTLCMLRPCLLLLIYLTPYSLCTLIYIIKADMFILLFVCLSVSMFRIAGQTAGPIETKLDTRTHVHPGSVSVKVNVKVIHVCVREWQITKHPERCAKATPIERLRNSVRTTCNYSSSNEARRRRAASAEGASKTPSGGRVRPEDG